MAPRAAAMHPGATCCSFRELCKIDPGSAVAQAQRVTKRRDGEACTGSEKVEQETPAGTNTHKNC